MEMFTPLSRFYEAIQEDGRIGPAHVSLFMALLQEWNVSGGQNPILIDRSTVMVVAKISARQTYNKCMHDLNAYGLLEYLPTKSRFIKSQVYLISV